MKLFAVLTVAISLFTVLGCAEDKPAAPTAAPTSTAASAPKPAASAKAPAGGW